MNPGASPLFHLRLQMKRIARADLPWYYSMRYLKVDLPYSSPGIPLLGFHPSSTTWNLSCSLFLTSYLHISRARVYPLGLYLYLVEHQICITYPTPYSTSLCNPCRKPPARALILHDSKVPEWVCVMPETLRIIQKVHRRTQYEKCNGSVRHISSSMYKIPRPPCQESACREPTWPNPVRSLCSTMNIWAFHRNTGAVEYDSLTAEKKKKKKKIEKSYLGKGEIEKIYESTDKSNRPQNTPEKNWNLLSTTVRILLGE